MHEDRQTAAEASQVLTQLGSSQFEPIPGSGNIAPFLGIHIMSRVHLDCVSAAAARRWHHLLLDVCR